MQQIRPSLLRRDVDLGTLAFGFAAGILATVAYATFRRREFDQVVDKTSDLAGQAENKAHRAINDLAGAAHHGIAKAEKAADHAVDSVIRSINS